MDLAEPRIRKNIKNGEIVPYGDDSTVLAVFSDEYKLNEYRTQDEGKPVYDHVIQVKLEYPGNNLSNYCYQFPPSEGVKGNRWTERFPRQWDAFCNQKEQVPDGTPIELWPPIDKARVLILKSLRIHTVEQVAGLTDAIGPNIGLDWRKLRDMAVATLKPDVGAAQISKMARENEELKSKMAALENQISSLAQIKTREVISTSVPLESQSVETSVTLDQPKRRGRPPKAA